MWQLQAPQLHHNEKQEERPGQTEYQEVLPMVPRAPGAQGDQALIQRLVPEGALPSARKRRPSRGALPGAARETPAPERLPSLERQQPELDVRQCTPKCKD